MADRKGNETDLSRPQTPASARRRPLMRHVGAVLWVGALGTSLAVTSFLIVRHYEDKWQREDFSVVARQPALELRRRTESVLEVLLSLGQLYAASHSVDRPEFRAFTSQPLRRHAEILALEWVPRIAAAGRVDFERTNNIVIVEPGTGGQFVPAATTQEYFPIDYTEPLESNRQALGLNYAAHPPCWLAMVQARDEDMPVITTRQELHRSATNNAVVACLIFLPVYHSGVAGETVGERRINLKGFVVASLHLEQLCASVLKQGLADQLELQLLDYSAPADQRFLHGRSSPPGSSSGPQPELWTESGGDRLQEVTRFKLANQEWAVVCRPTDRFQQRADWESWVVLGGGLLVTALFCSYLYSLLGRTYKIERTVSVRTRELAAANQLLQAEVAERKRTEKAISQSEARLQAILDNSTAVIYLKDINGHYLLINRQFERLFHVRRGEVKGKTDLDLFSREIADVLRVNDQQSIAAGKAVEFEEMVPVDGVLHTYLSIKFPLFDTDGAPYGVCGISTDITERVRTVQALRDSEALYHSLAESLPLNVVRKDLPGRVTFGNERFCRTLGRSLQDLLGKTDFDLFPPNLAEKYVADDRRVIATGEVFEDVEEHHTPDGGDLYMHVLKSPVLDAAGSVVGLQVIFWDVTARKRAEKALEKTAAELQRSNQELELFAYVASHDLQEPLRMIASYTQLLARRYKDTLDAEAHEYINYAVDGALRLQNLINDLLAYSRVGTKGKPFSPTQCEKILEAAMTNLKIAIEESGAVITHASLPALKADAVQLTQLFQNLLSNAIKFRGAEPPRIHVGCRPEGEGWFFWVKDNGIGIDPQYFERIFVIFQRLHSQQEYSGTGIGLALCKRILERHGGRIWVESEPGKGATFFFSLPAAL